MGGKAINKYFGLEEKRLPVVEYNVLVNEVLAILNNDQDFAKYSPRNIVIPAYRSKQDFGDADILIESNPNVNFRELIQRNFNVDPHHNAEVYSFPYKDFQVDFVCVQPDIFDISTTYFSYNDAGNLMGRGYHSLGLMYGHQGLFFVIRGQHFGGTEANTHIMNSVRLSVDSREILAFAGFDYDEFQNGFDKLEDMFDFVCRGKFFNAEKFNYENLNNTNKTRNRKRLTYTTFLEWLNTNKHKYNQFQFSENKLDYLPMICDNFPQLVDEFAATEKRYVMEQEISRKFNGTLVIEWTGFTGASLGRLISDFKKTFAEGEYSDYMYDYHADDVKNRFMEFFNNYIEAK